MGGWTLPEVREARTEKDDQDDSYHDYNTYPFTDCVYLSDILQLHLLRISYIHFDSYPCNYHYANPLRSAV